MQQAPLKLFLTANEAKQINEAIWEAFTKSTLSPDMVPAIKLAWETVDTFVIGNIAKEEN